MFAYATDALIQRKGGESSDVFVQRTPVREFAEARTDAEEPGLDVRPAEPVVEDVNGLPRDTPDAAKSGFSFSQC